MFRLVLYYNLFCLDFIEKVMKKIRILKQLKISKLIFGFTVSLKVVRIKNFNLAIIGLYRITTEPTINLVGGDFIQNMNFHDKHYARCCFFIYNIIYGIVKSDRLVITISTTPLPISCVIFIITKCFTIHYFLYR